MEFPYGLIFSLPDIIGTCKDTTTDDKYTEYCICMYKLIIVVSIRVFN